MRNESDPVERMLVRPEDTRLAGENARSSLNIVVAVRVRDQMRQPPSVEEVHRSCGGRPRLSDLDRCAMSVVVTGCASGGSTCMTVTMTVMGEAREMRVVTHNLVPVILFIRLSAGHPDARFQPPRGRLQPEGRRSDNRETLNNR